MSSSAVEVLSSAFTPASPERYLQIAHSFLTSFSFPIFVAYLVVVSRASWWKRNTKPVDLDRLMVFYNGFIAAVNVYCFLGFAQCLWRADSLFDRRHDQQLSEVYYLYWLTKVLELLDTLFMILRHKFRQISVLHVYHHATMLLLSDLGCSQYSWAAFAMPLMLNALVHVFLYTYYGLTAAGMTPAWKRRLTELQIAQFVIDLGHALVGVAHHNFCVWSIAYGVSMLYLFSSFYYHAYLRPTKKPPAADKKGQ